MIDRITRAKPRVVVVVAGPGWGKSFLGSTLLKRAVSGRSCAFDGVRDVEDADVRMLAAFGKVGWENGGYDLVVLDDVHALSAAGGNGRLEALLQTLPIDRRLVLLTRDPLSVDIFRFAAPHEILTLRREDIELSRDECRLAIAAEEMPRATRERAIDLCAGWPIATLLMSRLAREGRLAESLADLTGNAFGDVHIYLHQHLLTRLSAAELAVVIACAAIPNAGAEDISAALGYDAEPTLRELAGRRLPYLQFEGNAYVVHPIVEATIRATEPARIDAMMRAAADTHANGGKFVRAARMSLLAGDYARACAALDRSGPHAAGESMSAEYYEIANALPLEMIFGSQHIFTDYFGSRIVRSRPYEIYERVRKFCETLAPDALPIVRYSARIALFVTTRGMMKLRESEILARECIALAESFTDVPDRRMMLMCDFACLRGLLGKVEEAERLWEELHVGEAEGYTFYGLQLFILTFSASLYRGDRARLMELVDRNLEISRRWNDTPALVYGLGNRAVANAMFDPNVSFAAELAAIKADPAPSRFFYDAQRIVGFEDQFPTPTGCLLTVEAALAQTDPEVAIRLLDNAEAGFDRIGQPYWRIVVRLARCAVPGADRQRLYRACLELAEEIEVPAIAAQITALIAKQDAAGPYSGFLERVRNSTLAKGAARLRINVMKATVTRGVTEIPIRQREFEVAAILALAGTPVSVEQLCERVWPAAEPAAAVSALRMSVHRLRKQLGSNDVVRSVAAGYALSPDVGVDIVDAERTVSAARRLSVLGETDYARLRALFRELTTNRNAGEQYAWHSQIEARLQTVRHDVGALLARYDIARGQPVAALEAAETLLRFDPFDEPAVELTVRALLATGNRSEAAHRWRQYASRLEIDYAAQPSTTLQEIVSDVLVSL